MKKTENEIRISEAADQLGVHSRTAIRWAQDTLSGDPKRFQEGSVRRTIVGRYYVRRDEVSRILSSARLFDI